MVASYDDSSQARLLFEVTENTATQVTLKATSYLYHNQNSEVETAEHDDTVLDIDQAALDLSGARGVSLFDESAGDSPTFANGLEGEGLPLGSCNAFTVTVKGDLSAFGSDDAIFSMYDTKIAVPYLLTTIESGRSGRILTVCWLDGQECQNADIPDAPEDGSNEHLAWVVEQTSTGVSLRMYLNGKELGDPVGATPMIIDTWCIISEAEYPSGRATPPPPPAACDHEPLGQDILIETLRFGSAAATEKNGPDTPIVHARAYNYPLSTSQLGIDADCFDAGTCSEMLGLGSLSDVPPALLSLTKELEEGVRESAHPFAPSAPSYPLPGLRP